VDHSKEWPPGYRKLAQPIQATPADDPDRPRVLAPGTEVMVTATPMPRCTVELIVAGSPTYWQVARGDLEFAGDWSRCDRCGRPAPHTEWIEVTRLGWGWREDAFGRPVAWVCPRCWGRPSDTGSAE
jgi:hypothetical protein